MENNWIWNGKPIALRDLTVNQLTQINSLLTKNKGTTWFGRPSVDWRKDISNELTTKRSISTAKNVLNKLDNYKKCIQKLHHTKSF